MKFDELIEKANLSIFNCLSENEIFQIDESTVKQAGIESESHYNFNFDLDKLTPVFFQEVLTNE